jgi:hypothetical protein
VKVQALSEDGKMLNTPFKEERESMDISSVTPANHSDAVLPERSSKAEVLAKADMGVGPNSQTSLPALDVINDQLLSGEAHIDATTIELRYDPPIPGVDVKA